MTFDNKLAEALALIRKIDPGDVWGLAFNDFGENGWQAVAWGWDGTNGGMRFRGRNTKAVVVSGNTATEALDNMLKRLRFEAGKS